MTGLADSGAAAHGYRIRHRFARAALALAASLSLALPTADLARADSQMVTAETQLKAAFLYKFAGYVEWPPRNTPDPGEPFVIGVMDDDLLMRELTEIAAGRQIGGHPIVVRRVEHGGELDGLQILFIGDLRGNQLDALLQPARSLPILTVTETRDAISDGSIINFTVDRDRVRFEVSLAAAEVSKLKLSSRLLSVASRVHRQAN